MSENLFISGGEMGGLIRAYDWSQTPLGEIENWPQSLKTATRMILDCRYPMFIWWGHQMINLYNDAYKAMLGQRHPDALGQSAWNVWADVWEFVGLPAQAVLNTGQSCWNEDLLLVMERKGYREERYFTFSYSPLSRDDGGVGGVFGTVTEETERVLSDRRSRILRELGTETITARNVEAACEISTHIFSRNNYDLPFALLYLLNQDYSQARLISTSQLAVGTIASPEIIDLTSTETASRWPLAEVMTTGESQIIEDLAARFGQLPGGVWPDSPRQAVCSLWGDRHRCRGF